MSQCFTQAPTLDEMNEIIALTDRLLKKSVQHRVKIMNEQIMSVDTELILQQKKFLVVRDDRGVIIAMLILDPECWQIDFLLVLYSNYDEMITHYLLSKTIRHSKNHRHFQMRICALLSSVPFFLKEGFVLKDKQTSDALPDVFIMEKTLRPQIFLCSESFSNRWDAQSFSQLLYDHLPQFGFRVVPCRLNGERGGYIDALIGQSAYKRVWMPKEDNDLPKLSYAMRNNNAIFELSYLDESEDTTRLGKMIRHAITQGARRFFLVLTDNGPQDGGLGMLKELGFSLDHDEQGNLIPPDRLPLMKNIQNVNFVGLCLPQNKPLPQTELVNWLLQNTCTPGPFAGEGHGLGYVVETLLQGPCLNSVQALMKAIGFSGRIEEADILLCFQENMPDDLSGSSACAAAVFAHQKNIPTILITPDTVHDRDELHEYFDKVISMPMDFTLKDVDEILTLIDDKLSEELPL